MGLCYTCLTGTCLGAGPHAEHKPGEGAEVEAVLLRGGTGLCADCAREVAESKIST